MATYTHFAKQPDVLKHLILCEVLRNEAPQVYVETNSACAIYSMTQTPEQQYGIYHFLEKADDDKSLKDSIYYQLENPEMTKGNYLGSPALAMNVLEKQAKRFVFFDLEKSALENRQERRFRSNLSRYPDTGYSIRNEVFIMVWIHDRR